MSPEAVDALIAIVSGLISYLLGHRRGRKIHRSGDYIRIEKKDLL